MKFLFINSNLYGHVNPTLSLVRKLTERGNRVDYYCSEAFCAHITQIGAKWLGFGSGMQRFFREYRPTDKHPFYTLLEYMLLYDEAALPEILDMLKKDTYDAVICDSFFGGACFLRQILTIPVVCSHSSFAASKAPVPERMLAEGFHPQLDHCYRILRRISDTYHIKQLDIEQVFVSRGICNIVYTLPEFHGGSIINRPEYLFAGPSVAMPRNARELDLSAADGQKLIYISLGSLNTNFVDFYRMCLCTFREAGYFICMSVGDKCDISVLNDASDRFIVRRFMPQLEILEKADLFITHAGFNSVNEALYFGVPMLALPQMNDQHAVAKRLQDMRLGLSESIMELTPERLKAKTEEIFANQEIKDNCSRISQKMKDYNGLEETAISLEALMSVGGGVVSHGA